MLLPSPTIVLQVVPTPSMDPTRPPVAPKVHQSPIDPTHDQVVVLYVIVVYAVLIFGAWNIPGARNLINPLKLFTIGWHEFCHITAAILTGGTIVRVTIDPNLGGATIVEGGYPTIILAAGYVGSTFFGAAFTLAGWDTLVAKIMSFVLGLGLIAPLVLVRDKLTILLTLVYEGLLIGFWFIGHASALRWYCLFANESDATQWWLLYPSIGAHVWAFFWITFEVGVLIAFIFIGIASFKRTPDQMYAEAAAFLPT